MTTLEELIENPEEWEELPGTMQRESRTYKDKIKERNRIFNDMKALQLSKLNRATYNLILDVSTMVDPENNVLQFFRQSELVSLGLWGNVANKNLRIKGTNFDSMGFGFELPTDLLAANMFAVRVMHVQYDHYSKVLEMKLMACRSYCYLALADVQVEQDPTQSSPGHPDILRTEHEQNLRHRERDREPQAGEEESAGSLRGAEEGHGGHGEGATALDFTGAEEQEERRHDVSPACVVDIALFLNMGVNSLFVGMMQATPGGKGASILSEAEEKLAEKTQRLQRQHQVSSTLLVHRDGRGNRLVSSIFRN